MKKCFIYVVILDVSNKNSYIRVISIVILKDVQYDRYSKLKKKI